MTDVQDHYLQQYLLDEQATLELGQHLAKALTAPIVVYLSGDLGAGKTTLSRGLLRGLGHQGSVKSPTYTIVEPYELQPLPVYHFDLYRLGDPTELEYLGLRDYLNQGALLIFEWPERGGEHIPDADLVVHLAPTETGRLVQISARSDRGAIAMQDLRDSLQPLS